MFKLDKALKNVEKYYNRAVKASIVLIALTLLYDFFLYESTGFVRHFNVFLILYLIGSLLLKNKIDINYQLAVTIFIISIYGSYLFYMGGSNGDGAYLMLLSIVLSSIFFSLKSSLLILFLDLILSISILYINKFLVVDFTEIIGMLSVSIILIICINLVKTTLNESIENLDQFNLALTEEKNTVLKMASYDQLTELPNRKYFAELIDASYNKKKNGTIIFFNIIDFHKINEIHGYKTGDDLLRTIAHFLSSFVDEHDVLGYLGNNTYAYWSSNIYNRNEIQNLLDNQLAIFNKEHNKLLPISISSCVVKAENSPYWNIQNLLNTAERALNQIRKKGLTSIYLDDNAYEDLNLQDKLNDYIINSVQDDNYTNVFQEKYNTKAKTIYGLEVLSRLYFNEEFISPELFISVLEEKNHINEFGIYTYKKIFDKMKKIIANYGDEVVVSFNVSPKELVNPNYVENLKSLLEEYRINPKNIELEVTENVLISNLDQLLPKFKELHKYGIKISLDDFGSGYSSLKYFVNLPIDTIKIDKSFMKDVVNNEIQKSVISSIIKIANTKHISVVAEGIETLEQSNLLYDLGCYKIQGYYYSRPQKLENLINKKN